MFSEICKSFEPAIARVQDVGYRSFQRLVSTALRQAYRLQRVVFHDGDLELVLMIEPICSISYTWGDPAKLSKIDINGASFSMPQSAIEALARMRRPSQIRTLWIDGKSPYSECGEYVPEILVHN